MATATKERHEPRTLSADPTERQFDEEGYEVRFERVGDDLVAFSLKPYADGADANGVYHPEADQRPLYWNPIYPGGEMRFKSRVVNDRGIRPTIQKERWIDGKFRPRNDWENHMTREWMKRSLNGCNNPDIWKGVNHPSGGEWTCQCTWHCGNWQALEAHCRYLRHTVNMSG